MFPRRQPAVTLLCVAFPVNFRVDSFLLAKVSQKCSQLIHMHPAGGLASGLEIRNRSPTRQEKNDFYFNFIFRRDQKFS